MPTLERAWVNVRAKASKSDSAEIRAEVREFESNLAAGLKSIQSKLSSKRFVFKPSRGILMGKKLRPIVIAPLESRIVQRAILDVVQSIPAINKELHAGFNFGGVDGPGFGVPAAVSKAIKCAQEGGYFFRTDIKSFFVAVPRETATELICAHFKSDSAFEALFRMAVETELKDTEHLNEHMHLFPLYETGVAQGSCLSPLMCNYLLSSFDKKMNDRSVVCIRYIDDFILFAKNKNSATAAFRSAKTQLEKLGLSAYDPFDSLDQKKAESGRAADGFTFLGCEIRPNRVRPTAQKRIDLLDNIKRIFDESIKAVAKPQFAIKSHHQVETLSGALMAASNVVRGWGNTYSFCSDDRLMDAVDVEIDKLVNDYRKRFAERISKYSAVDRRRSIGLFCLVDCNRDDLPTSARTIALNYK